jgi:hypothetical protein
MVVDLISGQGTSLGLLAQAGLRPQAAQRPEEPYTAVSGLYYHYSYYSYSTGIP